MIKKSSNQSNEQSAADWYVNLRPDEQERTKQYYPNDLLAEINSSSPPTLKEVLTSLLRAAEVQQDHNDVITYAKKGLSLKVADTNRILFYRYLIKALVNVAIEVCRWDEVEKYCLQALKEYSRSKYPQREKIMDPVWTLRDLCKDELIHVATNRKNLNKEEKNLQLLLDESLVTEDKKEELLKGIRWQLDHGEPTYC